MSTNPSPKGLGSVLVIGGCGFLGHHVVNLISRSYTARISVLDLTTTRNRRSNVDYYDGDITNKEQVQNVFKKVRPDVVIHTASPPMLSHSKDLLYKVNVDGTRCLLDAAGESGCVKAFVYTSSASVISDTVADLVNADERWPVITGEQQTDYYADTKVLKHSCDVEWCHLTCIPFIGPSRTTCSSRQSQTQLHAHDCHPPRWHHR